MIVIVFNVPISGVNDNSPHDQIKPDNPPYHQTNARNIAQNISKCFGFLNVYHLFPNENIFNISDQQCVYIYCYAQLCTIVYSSRSVFMFCLYPSLGPCLTCLTQLCQMTVCLRAAIIEMSSLIIELRGMSSRRRNMWHVLIEARKCFNQT